ncbi:MAG: UvrD-helicase domain-containing protein [Deltaproteobacteria bacterium]|nr:UvrD-helicase domain-containing protein [Deltaproteobacteria bacterium]
MVDLSQLNPEQRAAVTHRDGPLLVLAGAGTGKTRVIAHRIASLVDEGEPPEHILALTFTQKAAGEMRERVAQLIGKRSARRAVMGTFHAFGVRLLRADVHRLGITDAFSILDEGDQRAQVRRLMREARIDERRAPVPDVIAAISLFKNQGALPPSTVATEAGRAALELLPAYNRHLRLLGAMDFDDLILLPPDMMDAAPDVAARIQRQFRHVLVDEFQDTSAAQMRFLVAVTGKSRTVCAVGDDDQAIYGWRGAVVKHILEFESWFPGAHVVALTENYRCTPAILETANRVIAHNRGRRPKTLRTPNPPGLPVRVIACNDEEHEVKAVTVTIAQRVRGGEKPERFAILLRTGTQSRPFEAALRLEGIPYVLVGGPDIADRKEVKDVLAYAAMLAGRDDESAFRRVMASPSRGVGPGSLEKLSDHVRAHELGIIDAALDAGAVRGLQKRAVVAIQELAQKLHKFRELQRAASERDDPTDRLRLMLEELGYLASLDDDGDLARSARRRQTVEIVLNALTRLATRVHESLETTSEADSRKVLDEGSALDQLMDRMALDREGDRRDDDTDDRAGVRIMTLHAAKGLEFPVVFLPGWEDGLMPHRRSIEDGSHAAPGPLEEGEGEEGRAAPEHVPAEGNGVEEERRLAYVGITRAREELVITRAVARRKYGKMVGRLPSRFIAEMPPGVVQEDQTDGALTPDEQRAQAADMFRRLREQMGGG